MPETRTPLTCYLMYGLSHFPPPMIRTFITIIRGAKKASHATVGRVVLDVTISTMIGVNLDSELAVARCVRR
jgi:hypothetical protein